jgi:hypothetical protein
MARDPRVFGCDFLTRWKFALCRRFAGGADYLSNLAEKFLFSGGVCGN